VAERGLLTRARRRCRFSGRLSVVFGLSIAIAPGADGKPVRDEPWVREQIAWANRLFEPAEVAFRWTADRVVPATAARMETRADRDALGEDALFEPRVVDVTIVDTLRDVDDPSRLRMGVCWQSRRDPARRYLIVASTARPTVLAHELGHFFGNPHTQVPNNLMSYLRPDPDAVAFDPLQLGTVRAHAKTALATGLLVAQLPARLHP